MTTQKDETLLRRISRGSWILLTVFFLASLYFRSREISAGGLAGGLVAIGSYRMLYGSLSRLLAHPQQGSGRGFKIGYYFRLGILGGSLYLLLVWGKVSPLGLLVGLSVVVLSILIATVQRIL